jgi:zinc and cadmium transporter
LLHKPADAFTISALLTKGGTRRQHALWVQVFFALLIPAGVLLFHVGERVLAGELGSTFTGCVLAFSAGTFVCIALSDLLPEVLSSLPVAYPMISSFGPSVFSWRM